MPTLAGRRVPPRGISLGADGLAEPLAMLVLAIDMTQELSNMRARLASIYPDVRQLGSGRAEFLRIGNDRQVAVVSVAEEGWLVEFWLVSDAITNEETLVQEYIVPSADEAYRHTCEWLGSQMQVEP